MTDRKQASGCPICGLALNAADPITTLVTTLDNGYVYEQATGFCARCLRIFPTGRRAFVGHLSDFKRALSQS